MTFRVLEYNIFLNILFHDKINGIFQETNNILNSIFFVDIVDCKCELMPQDCTHNTRTSVYIYH